MNFIKLIDCRQMVNNTVMIKDEENEMCLLLILRFILLSVPIISFL